jgi:serine protease Do
LSLSESNVEFVINGDLDHRSRLISGFSQPISNSDRIETDSLHLVREEQAQDLEDSMRQVVKLDILSKSALFGVCLLMLSSDGWGQTTTPTSAAAPLRSVTIPSDASLADERDAQFAELAEEASFFERQQNLMRKVVRLVSPSILHIEAIKETKVDTSLASTRGETKRIEEAGAGILVNIAGKPYAITNRHVIHTASNSAIKVETNERTRLDVLQVWSDSSTDIAVLEVSGRRLLPARVGDSTHVEMGDFVFAVGSPFGLNHSVTYGIISAKGRRNLELGARSIEIQDFFQTDAAINPGNSGGPLMNYRGEVIGINTAIASNSGGNEGIGFSIPMNMVMDVATRLVSHGQLQRGYLGVVMDNQFDASKAQRIGLSQTRGALVKAVKPGSPAEVAGLRPNDLIIEFDGLIIDNDGHLVQTVGLTALGKPIPMVILRDGKRYHVPVQLVEQPTIY